MNKIVDIIVTYNRIELLKENIQALKRQSFVNHDIMIIDNASTDGTKEMIEQLNDKQIIYYNTEKNIGGAGGFAFGLEKAMQKGYDFAWIMDDDSIPDNTALESLVNKGNSIKNSFSFLASLVYWTDNKLFPMNVPNFSLTSKNLAELDYLSKYKIITIKTCSFVGCYINLQYAKEVGLPISEFFIYGDDVEYTERLNKKGPSYLDLDSIIIHKSPSNIGSNIVLAEKERIERYYYQFRNTVYIYRKKNKRLQMLKLILKYIIKILLHAPDCKIKRINTLLKGSFKGLFFNPEIKYIGDKKDKNEI